MTVKIYTKPNCQQCNMTKKLFQKNNVFYTEINGLEHIDELKEKGFASFPVIETDNDSWSGFKPDKIKTLIN